jgi:hypothetical protein
VTTGLRPAAAGLFAILSAGAMLLATTPAQAAVTATASCDPKVDEELAGQWYNTCGDVFYYLDNAVDVDTIRSPFAPYHRIWFHQYANETGLTACFYSTGNDIYPVQYMGKYGVWVVKPWDIQVSANENPC